MPSFPAQIPSIRWLNLLIFLACLALMAVALVFQYALELEPCPLCITQRVFVIAIGLFALAAFFHQPAIVGHRIYAGVCIVMAIAGIGVAARHVWLQSLPEHLAPACGPGISYMFDTFPLWEALSILFAGDGNCNKVVWQFLGLSIPAWTLVCFIGLLGLCVFQFIRRPASNF